MADQLDRATAWLAEKRKSHLSRTVVYTRGASSVVVEATAGQTTFEVVDAYGVAERVQSRDFVFDACDLVLDGSETLPERGDRIREAQDEREYVYEVLAPGQEPCWRYSDPYRRTLRVHTKQVAE